MFDEASFRSGKSGRVYLLNDADPAFTGFLWGDAHGVHVYGDRACTVQIAFVPWHAVLYLHF